MRQKNRDYILKAIQKRKSIKSAELVAELGISRQALARHLRSLIAENKIQRQYSTKKAVYSPLSSMKSQSAQTQLKIAKTYKIQNLDENRVFVEIDLRLGLKNKLHQNVYDIAQYAFTEMVNNAIDHSASKNVFISFSILVGELQFEVLDRGIGIFENIKRRFRFRDHFEAVEHLLKGKQTTDPKRHSGQGIFFTSKIADKFLIKSGHLELVIDNKNDDVALKDIKQVTGTSVQFQIKSRSKKNLKKLFDEYSNSDFEFDKTKIMVRLSSSLGSYVSRSEAKRLLFGLDKFKRIVFDFNKVKSIGQGFADEIFRVYKNAHTDIEIDHIHAADAVRFMIHRAIKN